MAKYRITGADRDTGEAVKLVVDEPTRGAVERWAEEKGILWSSIDPVVPERMVAATARTEVSRKARPLQTLAVASLLAGIAGIVHFNYWTATAGESNTPQSAIRPTGAAMSAPTPAHRVLREPDFNVRHEQARPGGDDLFTTYAYRITNTGRKSLTVYAVVINGEWTAAWAHKVRVGTDTIHLVNTDLNSPLPSHVLSIGESVCAFQAGRTDADERVDYWKEVIFLDIHTDRGVFRYRGRFQPLELIESPDLIPQPAWLQGAQN